MSVWLRFKSSKRILLQWSHHTHNITFLPWGSTFEETCRDSSLLLPLNIVIKVISQPWNKTCHYEYVIFLIFSLRIWGSQTLSLLIFPIFFKWWLIMGWYMLRSSVNYWVFFSRLHFINSLKTPWPKKEKKKKNVGLVLWHINHCRLFNTKYYLYICIKYIWFVNTLCW